MQKKGDFKVGPIIIVAVVAVVLVILFTSAIPWIAGKRSFLKFNFKNEGNIENELDILRYDLVNGELEYYDGDTFIDFSGKNIKLKGKTINYDTTKKIIDEHIKDNIDLVIYDGEFKLIGPKKSDFDIEIKLKQKEEIGRMISNSDIPYFSLNFLGEPEIYLRYITEEAPSLGWEWAIRAAIWLNTYSIEVSSCKIGESDLGKNNCDIIKKLRDLDKVQGLKALGGKQSINSRAPLSLPHNGESLTLTSGGDLYKGEVKFNREFGYGLYELLFKDEAQKWRDSVLKEPIALIVDTEKDFVGAIQPFYICSELIENRYLTLRVSKEVAFNSVCKNA